MPHRRHWELAAPCENRNSMPSRNIGPQQFPGRSLASHRSSGRFLAASAAFIAIAAVLAIPAFLPAMSQPASGFALSKPGISDSSRHILSNLAGSAVPAAITPTGNISLSAALPNVSLPSGSQVEVSYTFHVLKWPKSVSSLTVTIPSELAHFPLVSGGTLSIWTLVRNFTINSTASYGGNVTLVQHSIGASGANFASGTHAVLSSQILAIMETVRWGVAPIDFQWQWRALASAGTLLASGSSPSITIDPQAFVNIVSAGPSTLKPGQNYTVCVGGPIIANRTLSLHMEVPNPYRAFAWSTTHVPAGTTGSWCWKVALPSNFAAVPSNLLVHVWSYATQPGLLYVLHTQAV